MSIYFKHYDNCVINYLSNGSSGCNVATYLKHREIPCNVCD